MLAYLAEDLYFNNKVNEALGIYLRNELDSYVRGEIKQKLLKEQYD